MSWGMVRASFGSMVDGGGSPQRRGAAHSLPSSRKRPNGRSLVLDDLGVLVERAERLVAPDGRDTQHDLANAQLRVVVELAAIRNRAERHDRNVVRVATCRF